MGQSCNIEGCTGKSVARGWCKRHYARWQYHGDPEKYPYESSWWALNRDTPCTQCNRLMRKASDPPDGRPIYRSTGICASCTKRLKEGGVPRKYTAFDSDGQTCNKCMEYLPYAEFQKILAGRPTPSGYHGTCNTCQKLNKHHISKREYLRMYESQKGCCALCSTPSDGLFGLFVDHDHACCNHNRKSCGKCFRGLLCTQCNVMLGMARDNTTTLQRAIDYLRKTENIWATK